MNRDYSTGKSDQVRLFVGQEVEHTPAYGLRTLFVCGTPDHNEINEFLKTDRFVKHIFFGANHSFDFVNDEEFLIWTKVIENFLLDGYLCSLDIPLSYANRVLEDGLTEHSNFIPQIRIPLPYIKLWNYNTMIKIDDQDFESTNPGVWCHSLHDLMDRRVFTDWNQYKNDKVLK
jgi:hypothetical protein